ncbi:MAG: aminotransferase class III-fold pyridoxal phosphate-dependent enzyme [Nanoarchaeota archaeon]|nr:aminotransferase class III-fold pyridoxal phosphate-dependent enzyme [Nanoarchaeota archaeon]
MGNCVFTRDLKKEFPVASRGIGIYILDEQGREYLDACGGVVAVSLGYDNEFIQERIKEQAGKLCFAHTGAFLNKPVIDLSDKIMSKLSHEFGKAYFVSGGSEANETAIKLARQYWHDKGEKRKIKIVSRLMSYHGNSLGALSLSGNPARQKLYAPMMKSQPKAAPNYCYRCAYGKIKGFCDFECAQSLKKIIQKQGKENIAAFIAEPVVGASCCGLEGSRDYFKRIRQICDENDILLIFDEVMSGIGRTGKWFAFENYGVEPDIFTLGKGLSSGYIPLAAVVCKDKIAQGISKGIFVHGFTFSGHALAAAAGTAVFDYIEKEHLLEKVQADGRYLFARLQDMKEKIPYIGDVRGLGFMAGIEFVKDNITGEPFPENMNLAAMIKQECWKNGMLIFQGTRMKVKVDGNEVKQGDHVMLAPHFTTTRQELDTILNTFETSIKAVMERING